jgi:hypothetical protein
MGCEQTTVIKDFKNIFVGDEEERKEKEILKAIVQEMKEEEAALMENIAIEAAGKMALKVTFDDR